MSSKKSTETSQSSIVLLPVVTFRLRAFRFVGSEPVNCPVTSNSWFMPCSEGRKKAASARLKVSRSRVRVIRFLLSPVPGRVSLSRVKVAESTLE